MLQAVRVFPIAAILRPARGLSISGVPWLRADGTQKGGGMEGAGTDFNIIGLQQDTALAVPEFLQAQDNVLKGQHVLHSVSKAAGAPRARQKPPILRVF